MKILSIGNSFSEDATAYLHKISEAGNSPIDVYNLYIGGCSLEMHACNIKSGEKKYRLEYNGRYTLAAVWFEIFTGKDIRKVSFFPDKSDIVNGFEIPDGFTPDDKKIKLANCNSNLQ